MADMIPFTGKMDTKVQVYRMEMTVNELSEHIPAEVLVVDTWAMQDSEVGNLQVNEKVEHIVTSSFTIGKRNGLVGSKELKLVANGISYRVTHIRPIQRSHLKIICTSYD